MGGVSDERTARMRLSQLAEPGDRRLGRELAASSAPSVLERIEANDRTLRGVEHYRARLSVSPVGLGDSWAEAGGRYLIPGDGEWPTQLEALGPSAPWGLFVVGAELRMAAVRSVAVVGARAASQYGLHVASDLASDLATRGWAVVSGGAYGIDAAAHRGALAVQGTTIAALAFGVDVAYPRGNASLFARLRDEGGVLVSEFPPGATPTKPRFLTRNRVIAALTRGTVVVEAAARSGALNTAAVARRLGRPVLVVPGPITSAQSVGCHRLARGDDPARIVTDASEVIEEVGLIGELATVQEPLLRVRDALDPTSLRVLEAMPSESAISVGELSLAAGIEVGATGGVLLRLVATGLVREAAAGFVRVPGAADTVVRRSP